jgi:hypothetical protein
MAMIEGNAASAILAALAALLETVRFPGPAAHRLAWWAARRGPEEARLCVRWALTEGEAAAAGIAERTFSSEWRFGPSDELPREIEVVGAPPARARAGLARYVFLDANRSSVWMEADPLAELLAGIARQDVAATRVCCRVGVGMVASSTPDSFAAITGAIAPVFPALRVERVACAPGEAPVACFCDGQRVELDQLVPAERDALYVAATVHAARVRDGVVFIDRPELHAGRRARRPWLDWLAGLAGSNQLVVAVGRRGSVAFRCNKVAELGAESVPEEHVQDCEDCQANLRIVNAICTMSSGVESRPGWENEVLARIAELEAQRRGGSAVTT